MKIKLLLILAFSSFYSIHAMRISPNFDRTGNYTPQRDIPYTIAANDNFFTTNNNFLTTNCHLFVDRNCSNLIFKRKINKSSEPKLDTTKKLILLYNQGSDKNQILFPCSLSKFTDFFKDVKPEDLKEDLIFPIPVDIDQKSIDKISEMLIKANEKILPTDSEIEKKNKIKDAACFPLYLLPLEEHIKLINITEFLGIPGLQEALEESLATEIRELKKNLYKENPNTKKQELLVSDYIFYNIIEIIKRSFIGCTRELDWDSEKQKIIKSQTNTLDQALFIKQFIIFLRKTQKNKTLEEYLEQNPNTKKIFETFPAETQEILKTTTYCSYYTIKRTSIHI